MQQQFYQCKKCGQIVAIVKKEKCPVMCCGQPMELIAPNTVDAAKEKHIPVWTVEGNLVKVVVGSTAHPMLDAHYIEWISLQTKAGNQRKCLKPGDAPEAVFALVDGDEVEAVYAYCNLHGLWQG